MKKNKFICAVLLVCTVYTSSVFAADKIFGFRESDLLADDEGKYYVDKSVCTKIFLEPCHEQKFETMTQIQKNMGLYNLYIIAGLSPKDAVRKIIIITNDYSK